MRRVALLLLPISLVACRGDDGASGADETGGTGETGDEDAACDDAFETLVETQPLLDGSYGDDELFVWAGMDVILSWDAQGGWRTQYVPDLLGTGNAVWGSSPDDVFMWGTAGDASDPDLAARVLHWDGSELAASLELTQDEAIYAIHGTGPDDVWAVGDKWCPQDPGCEGRVFHYDGESWTPHELPGVRGLRDVWARGSGDVYVVGEQTVHYDGATWSVVADAGPSLVGITGDATRIVGYEGQGLFELGQQGWEPIALPGGVGYVLTVVLADDGLWVEGSFDGEFRLSRLAGGEWQSFALDATQVWGMVGVAGRPWVGVSAQPWDLGHEVLEVRDIEQLEPVFFDSRIGHLYELAGWSLDNLHAIALNDERSGVAKLGPHGWQWLVSEDLEDVEVLDLAVDADGDAWLAGVDYFANPAPALWRIEGTAAVPFEPAMGLEAGTRSVWVGAKDDIWLLGELAHHYDGESWLSIAAPPNARAIASAGGHVYAWSGTTLFELRNGSWVSLLNAEEQILDVELAGPLSVWVIERYGLGEFRVQVFDGDTWVTHELGTRGLCDATAAAPDDVHVSGWWQDPGGRVHGVLMHWDGEAWSSIDTPATHCVEALAIEEGVVLGEGGSSHVLECRGRHR